VLQDFLFSGIDRGIHLDMSSNIASDIAANVVAKFADVADTAAPGVHAYVARLRAEARNAKAFVICAEYKTPYYKELYDAVLNSGSDNGISFAITANVLAELMANAPDNVDGILMAITLYLALGSLFHGGIKSEKVTLTPVEPASDIGAAIARVHQEMGRAAGAGMLAGVTYLKKGIILGCNLIHALAKVRAHEKLGSELEKRARALTKQMRDDGDVADTTSYFTARALCVLEILLFQYPVSRATVIVNVVLTPAASVAVTGMGMAEAYTYCKTLLEYGFLTLVGHIDRELLLFHPEILAVPSLEKEAAILESIQASVVDKELVPYAGILGQGIGMQSKTAGLGVLGALALTRGARTQPSLKSQKMFMKKTVACLCLDALERLWDSPAYAQAGANKAYMMAAIITESKAAELSSYSESAFGTFINALDHNPGDEMGAGGSSVGS